jgi:mono/diheme cytochrome c family protein
MARTITLHNRPQPPRGNIDVKPVSSAASAVVAIALLSAAYALAAEISGKADFDQNCASCHGTDGKGNGPALYTIPGVHPPDLTQLSRNNGGQFPTADVYNSIDGRKKVPSHERLTMPFWGVTMQSEGNEFTPQSDAEVKKRINDIVSYIESIQQK